MLRPQTRLAALGFVGHAPGLWIFARHKLDPATARLNVAAVGATVGAMIAGGLAFGGRGVFVCWLVAHFVWSAILAVRLFRQSASPSEKSTS